MNVRVADPCDRADTIAYLRVASRSSGQSRRGVERKRGM